MSGQACGQDDADAAGDGAQKTTPTTPPPPPVPETDPKLAFLAHTPPPIRAAAATAAPTTNSAQDLFKLTPTAALQLLCAGVEALVGITGDVPPTPPPTSPTIPHMRGMQREKAAIVRSHSDKNLARVAREQPPPPSHPQSQKQEGFFPPPPQALDGVRLRSPAAPAPPPPPPAVSEPYIVIGADSQPLNLQHSAITRKFFSKAPPPISVEDYLMRLHRFCPMSTAVYLATSLYIFRLAVEERAIPVTRRNCHRLLLAGLRVAMKALEDLSYPHAKFARVGGVSEVELARLEISFCFLAGFELVVGEETLRRHWETLKQGRGLGGVGGAPAGAAPYMNLKLDLRRKKNLVVPGPA
ncbi:cyclin-domain-containing protein [Xylariaceae sp. FL0804]|nr:cyclin-domain-containing protein [Xylariaceae sp. FL0804]